MNKIKLRCVSVVVFLFGWMKVGSVFYKYDSDNGIVFKYFILVEDFFEKGEYNNVVVFGEMVFFGFYFFFKIIFGIFEVDYFVIFFFCDSMFFFIVVGNIKMFWNCWVGFFCVYDGWFGV